MYVVGYPDILPTEGTCNAVGVSAEVLGPVTEIAGLLNASLEKGATAAGASYIDMEAISEGHDVCAKGRAWVNGPRFRAGVAAPFHPKINGMRAVAAEIYRTIIGRGARDERVRRARPGCRGAQRVAVRRAASNRRVGAAAV